MNSFKNYYRLLIQMGVTKKIPVNKIQDVGLVRIVNESELTKMRKLHEILEIKDDKEKAIYDAVSLGSVQHKYPDLFPEKPNWRLRQMIDYVAGSNESPKKVRFLTAVLKIGDPKVCEYIERKSNGKYSRAVLLRDQSETKPKKMDMPRLNHDLYVVPQTIMSITGLPADVIISAARGGGMDTNGSGSGLAFNLRTLIPYLWNVGRKEAAIALYSFYS